MKKIILIFIFFFICFLSNYVEIPHKSIRLRVISSTNTQKDLDNKQLIFNLLTKKINYYIKNSSNIEESNNIIINNKNNINLYIKQIFKTYNIKEKYKIYYGYNFFPEKNYNGVLYKSGFYKSLVIVIGKGKGDNCWCSLYPDLCLLRKTQKKEYHLLIKDIFLNKKMQVI